MRIALLGSRGIPANYGGFETFVEQLGQRLVERGHDVTVYCRSHQIDYPHRHYKGVRLVKLPTIKNKYLDTIVHTLFSFLHAVPQRYDVVLCCNVGNSPLSWITRVFGTPTVLHVDGLDWTREKWPSLAKRYIRFAERLATIFPNLYITDSRVVQDYYQKRFKKYPLIIPYGSEVENLPPGVAMARFGLKPRDYILFVGRLVPENCVDHLVKAFRELDTDMKCVIVGGSSYAESYVVNLHKDAQNDPRIVFTGYLFGSSYHELGSNAYLSVITSAASGTHPALVEAMGFGNCVVVHDIPENLETIGDAGFTYDGKAGADSLREVLRRLLANPDLVQEYGQKAHKRVQKLYSWDAVTDEYEKLFCQICGEPLPERLNQPSGYEGSMSPDD